MSSLIMKNRALIRLFIFLICNHLIETCMFGEGCTFPCHCQGGETCDTDTGGCQIRCDAGTSDGQFVRTGAWQGAGCQIGNVAYDKSATQVDAESWENAAFLAIDGNHNPTIDLGHCATVRAADGVDAWWEVYLGDTYVIQEIVITNADSNPGRLRNIIVNIHNSTASIECGTTSQNAMDETVVCDPPRIGSHVRLEKMDAPRLQLCEVMVTGYLHRACAVGSFGPGCLSSCNCECDGISGECIGPCLPGWADTDCQIALPQIIVDDLSWTIDGNFLFLSIPPVAESLLLAEMSVEAKNESSTTWQTVGQIWRPPLGQFIYEVKGLDQGVVYDVRVIAYYEADDKRYEGHPSQPLRASYQEKPLSSREIGLIVGLVCSIIILFVVAFGVFCYRKRSARTEVSGVVGPRGDGEQEMNVPPSGPPTDSDEYEELALPHTTEEGGVRQDIEPGPGHMYENME